MESSAHSRVKKWTPKVFGALLVTLVVSAVHAQEAPPVFTATSELVVVDVQVVHNKNKTPAPALRKEDLQVFEDGTAQNIAFFSRDELPLSIVLLLLSGPPTKSNPPGNPHKYAELTGGEAFPLGGKRVDERLAEMIDELRSRYTIGFRPSEAKPAGTYCKLL